ncbi:YceI family protein [Novosphingobium album (ex Hu et al. 2023)]|uniref:YceI family protein n=1 Tax=Novosphingobium album (ex Hu et al. 2023) TaxID=2930093 RepID=A0ABT0AZ36_9SPHN|nr:YceI family protein [Novosphingobium album (ex Hu et al. 2023)]MCJ2177933.1 YceI family protein [Novosphingobium album (ex Hu et al. 2023)]
MHRLLASALTAVSIVVSVPLFAQQADTRPAAVQAGDYVLDSSHTLVRFTVDHFGISEFFGTFAGASGTLSLDPKNLASAKLDVSVPVGRVSTTNTTLDEELVSADWFDAGKYPAMRFVSTKVVKTGARTADVTGNLTMHGVTRPVTLKATFKAGAINPMNKTYTLGFNATGMVRRTEFGVSKYAPLVSDETVIAITAAFEKQAD